VGGDEAEPPQIVDGLAGAAAAHGMEGGPDLTRVVCGQARDAFQHNVRITLSKDVLDFVVAGAFLGGSNGQK
jgi:hypothetical protein